MRCSVAWWLGGCAGLAAALTGCAGHPPLGAWESSSRVEVHSVQPLPAGEDVRGLLERLATQDPERLGEARAAARDATAAQPRADAALWLALLTLVGPGSPEADAEALAALQAAPPSSVAERGQAGLDLLARQLLQERLATRRELNGVVDHLVSAEEQARRLEEQCGAQRDQEARCSERLAAQEQVARDLQTRLADEERRAQALQDQIDQLKTIERIIDKREEPRPKESPQ